MIHDLIVPAAAPPRRDGHAQFGTITAQDAQELLAMGQHHNVAGAIFTTDGNAVHFPNKSDHYLGTGYTPSTKCPLPVAFPTTLAKRPTPSRMVRSGSCLPSAESRGDSIATRPTSPSLASVIFTSASRQWPIIVVLGGVP
jgi:hypothetical protein